MKKNILALILLVTILSGSLFGIYQSSSNNVYETEVTMHRGYVEDVGFPDGPGR